MKKLFLTTAAAAALSLSACGGSNTNNGAANTSGNLSTNSTGSMSGPAPAPAPMAANSTGTAATGDLRSQLVGRWGRNGSCAESMEFRADGGISIPRTTMPPQVRWDVQGNQIVFSAPGEASQPLGTAVVTGTSLQLTTPTGQTTTLNRCP
jgi:hypothetical protein